MKYFGIQYAVCYYFEFRWFSTSYNLINQWTSFYLTSVSSDISLFVVQIHYKKDCNCNFTPCESLQQTPNDTTAFPKCLCNILRISLTIVVEVNGFVNNLGGIFDIMLYSEWRLLTVTTAPSCGLILLLRRLVQSCKALNQILRGSD